MPSFTMTIMDVYYELRKLGIRSSPKKVGQLIQSGDFPFGKVISTGETGRCSYLIYRVDFETWVESIRPRTAESA